MQTITSVQNDKIKYVVRLSKESALRRSDMAFIVEGIRMVREVPVEDILELFVTEEALCKYNEIEDIIDKIDDESKCDGKNFRHQDATGDSGGSKA